MRECARQNSTRSEWRGSIEQKKCSHSSDAELWSMKTEIKTTNKYAGYVTVLRGFESLLNYGERVA
jgi:hypothetical protein